MEDKKWIKKAIKNPGSLTNKAKKAGKSIGSYCSDNNLSMSTKKQCVLRKTLMKFNK